MRLGDDKGGAEMKWSLPLVSVMQAIKCFVLCRSFQGHHGGVEHISFDGSTIISTSTDL